MNRAPSRVEDKNMFMFSVIQAFVKIFFLYADGVFLGFSLRLGIFRCSVFFIQHTFSSVAVSGNLLGCSNVMTFKFLKDMDRSASVAKSAG